MSWNKKKQNSEWYQKNREYIRAKQNNLKFTNTKSWLLWKTKASAKKRGIEFDLVEDDLSIPEVCPILKVPFDFGAESTMTVDRIDNSKGYVRGNIQVISMKANTMKSNATQKELISFAKWIGDSIGEPSRIIAELESEESGAED